MNIMIGKYGKSCLFNEKSWGIIGGDEAPSTFFIKLAQAYPQHKFYMVGRSDLKQFRKVQRSKLSAFIKKDEECGVNRLKFISQEKKKHLRQRRCLTNGLPNGLEKIILSLMQVLFSQVLWVHLLCRTRLLDLEIQMRSVHLLKCL